MILRCSFTTLSVVFILLSGVIAHAQVLEDVALRMASHSELNCADGAICGPVVMIVIAENNWGVPSWCTGTLVAPDLVLTAAHCIPREIRANGASCRGSMAVVWPGTPRRAAPTACDEVVFTETPAAETIVRDAALIRLVSNAPSRIRPMRVDSAGGLPDGLAVLIPAVHGALLGEDGVLGTVRSHSCVMAQNSITLPLYDSPFRPEGLAVGCENMINGNSGAAVLDRSGRVRAVFHASFDFRHSGSEWHWPAALAGYEPSSVSPVAWVTNLACESGIRVALGERSPVLNTDCSQDLDHLRGTISGARDDLAQRILHDSNGATIVVGADRVPRF